MLKTIVHGLCDLIYPPHCYHCQTYLDLDFSKGILCLGCLQLLKPNIPPFCIKCSRHIGRCPSQPLCKTCKEKNLHFNFAWSAYLYDNTLKELLHKFKYGQKTALRFPFAQIMIQFIDHYNFDIRQFDIITPIPLHPTSFRERGYNQAHLLAAHIAVSYHIPLSTNNLIKVRQTKNQVHLSEKERWTNIRQAFRIKNSKEFNNRNILIIDDLLTTGATVSEAALTLKTCKTKTLGVLTLASTPQQKCV